MNVVALGNTGAGKSAVLNSLIGHPALPTGEGGATRAPICIDLKRDDSLSSKSIVLQIGSKSHPVSASALKRSLLDRLSKNSSKNQDNIYLKLRTSTVLASSGVIAAVLYCIWNYWRTDIDKLCVLIFSEKLISSLKLVDLPGVDKGNLGDSLSQYAKHSDATLLVIIPASQALDISSAEALRIAKEFDGESTRTIGVISKIDQAASESKVLTFVQALLNQGSHNTSDIPWVALIDQSVSIASAQSGSVGSDNSLETAWRAESESLKSILAEAPQSKLGRHALVETLAQQIRKRMNVRSDEVAVKAFHDMMAARGTYSLLYFPFLYALVITFYGTKLKRFVSFSQLLMNILCNICYY